MTEIQYKLTADEVRSALYLTKKLKPYKKKSLIQAIAAGVIFITFLVSAIMDPKQTTYYIAMVAMLFVIGVVTIVPKRTEDRIVKGALSDMITVIRLKGDKITVNVPESRVLWDIEKDEVAYVKHNEVIYAIALKDGRILVIPKRAAEETVLNELQQIINYFTTKDIAQ